MVSVHENVKSEICHICQKGFAVRYNLVAHIKKVHKVDPDMVEKVEKLPQLLHADNPLAHSLAHPASHVAVNYTMQPGSSGIDKR